MGSLSAFLSQNAIQKENVEYVASKRFIGENGDPEKWTLKCITSVVDEEIRKSCTKRVPVVGRKGQYTAETDYNEYVGRVACACTVFPDLKDAELQNSYGVMGELQLLKAMLTPGEYAEYLGKVQEVCGFVEEFDAKVEEVKN